MQTLLQNECIKMLFNIATRNLITVKLTWKWHRNDIGDFSILDIQRNEIKIKRKLLSQ